MAGKKVNRLIVPNVYTANGVEPVTSVNNILPVNGNVTIPIPTVPTNVSAFTNDAGYLTSATLDGYATQSWVQQQGYLTSVPSQYITDTELSTTLADYVTGSSLSTTLNSYATVTSLSTETSDRMNADDSLQSQINDKYDASNPSGFISGISSSDVITALGYTPYNNSNPNGYITSAALSDYVTNTDLATTLADYAQTTDIPTVGNGTITINQGGVQKGTFTVNQSGNSTINLDAGGSSGTVDQTYDSTSANAQSGVAIAKAKFVQNMTTGTNSINIGGDVSNISYCTNIGVYSQVGNVRCTALGYKTNASGANSICIGNDASASATSAIQIGQGTNSTANTLQVGFSYANTNYQLLDGTTGLIPDARISSNIARRSEIPTVPTNVSAFTNDSGYITGITSSDVTTALGYTPYNSTNPNGYQANVIETIEVNNTAQTVTNKAVNITVPTNTNQLTNGAGFITGITSSNVTTALGYTPADNTLSNVSSIDSSSAVATALNGKADTDLSNLSATGQAIINGKANTDLSNLSATGKKVIDGQWVWVNEGILSDASLKNSSKTPLPKTVTLPNDSYAYEVMIRGRVTTGTTSGNYLKLQMAAAVNGTMYGSTVFCCSARTRSASAVEAQGTVIVPNMKYGTNNLIIMRDANFNGTADLTVIAYRRLGTNT